MTHNRSPVLNDMSYLTGLISSLQGSGMSFNYYDIPMFALDDEKEVDALLDVSLVFFF